MFYLVPLAMLALAFVMLGLIPEVLNCSHCNARWPYIATFIVCITFGWFVYYALLTLTFLKRLIVR
jgi:hypothetical protein